MGMISKNKRLLISSAIIILAVILSVVGFFILPDTLIMQITTSGTGGTTMPKLLGIIVTFAICSVFSVLYYINDNSKYIVFSIIGICLYGFMFFMNI